MNTDEVLQKINSDREKIEACFVFSLWSDPELYEAYSTLNEGKDNTLTNKDAIFYYNLGKAMYKQGFKNFDNVTLDTFLDGKPEIKKRFEEYGGYHEVKQLVSIVNPENVAAYFDKISKMNSLSMLFTKYQEMFNDVNRFQNASNEDVYNTFELLNNSVSLTSGHNEMVENLTVDDGFIAGLESGENIGFNYGKYCPILNYITLGAPGGSLYMVAGHSGTGKTSFTFGNIVMGLHEAGVGTAIISNEMKSEAYKLLLLEHILTHDLNYWGLTRKQLKMGKFTDEQKTMVKRAAQISQESYSDIKFVKMFDNSTDKIIKYLKKLKAQGTQCVLYDTFKSDDVVEDSSLWQQLMLSARKLFQTASKLDMCIFTTYQLALSTVNVRYLDATCLSNSKQIKEVFETMTYWRPLWADEYTGEKYDVHAYKLNRDNKKIKEELILNKDKKYSLCFIDKTRSDEDKQILIYEWNAQYNSWVEKGWAKVINEHNTFR